MRALWAATGRRRMLAALVLLFGAPPALGETHLAKFGRLPTRGDVMASPPGILERLHSKTVVATVFNAEDERKWRETFNALFKPR